MSKTQISISKQQIENKLHRDKEKYDLEERTLDFARRVIKVCKSLHNDRINNRLTDQIIRSAGSIGANYREANDSLGKKDFVHRLKIARKEAKETTFWLELILEANQNMKEVIDILIKETIEIRNIISAIINKVEVKRLKFGN